MDTLIIIGSGFDIAHDLPTRYSDFKSYLENNTESSDDKYFYDSLNAYIDNEILWSSFEKALGILDEDKLRDDCLTCLPSYGDEDWSDSGHYSYQYELEKRLQFSSQISMYLKRWINQIYIENNSVFSSKLINQNYLFVSFNYTDTLEQIYKIPNEKILYIHGRAKNSDELIAGHHDKNLLKNDEVNYCDKDTRIESGNFIINDYYNKTFKNTESIIKENILFFDSLSKISTIYVLGHSLSEIDIDYFEKIKSIVLSNAYWHISYYNENDKKHIRNFKEKLELHNLEATHIDKFKNNRVIPFW